MGIDGQKHPAMPKGKQNRHALGFQVGIAFAVQQFHTQGRAQKRDAHAENLAKKCQTIHLFILKWLNRVEEVGPASCWELLTKTKIPPTFVSSMTHGIINRSTGSDGSIRLDDCR